MRIRSIRTKLLFNSLSTILVAFLVVGFLVYYGLMSLSGRFLGQNEKRAQEVRQNLQAISDQNIANISQIYQTALEKKRKPSPSKRSHHLSPAH